jgi:multicomponent Na+:H+ antiporter subunit B
VSRRTRLAVFAAGAAGLAVVLGLALAGLPHFGGYDRLYGRAVPGIAVTERHGTDTVTVTTFDIRGYDTLGEEFILFAAVLGVTALLRARRAARGDEERRASPIERPASTDAARAVGLAMVGPTVLVGLDIATHGQLTPGGGFQAGVILASAALLVFVAGSYVALRRVRPIRAVELAEAGGAAGFALIGLGGLVFASTFFENFLPFGTIGSIVSAGTIPLSSLSVALEVTGAFILLLSEFLDQDLLVPEQPEA